MIINGALRLAPAIAVKGVSMILVFYIANLIITHAGLEVYGAYAQSISLLLLFISTATFGFSHSFIRKSAKLNTNEKLKLFTEQSRIIFSFTVLLCPFLFIISYAYLGLSLFSACILSFAFLLFSAQRLRFSYIRTTRKVSISEAPDLLIKNLTLVCLIVIFSVTDIVSLHVYIFSAFLIAYFSQKLICNELPLFQLRISKNIEDFLEHLDNFDLKIWVNNILLQARDFIELTLVIAVLGAAVGGEYKLLSQFTIAFMVVYNSANLMNSFSYAKLAVEHDTTSLNKKAYNEMRIGLCIFSLMILILIALLSFIDIFKLFQLKYQSYLGFYILLGVPLINLLTGPLTQLNIHFVNMNVLICAQIFRIISICSIVIVAYLGFSIDLLKFIVFKLMIEIGYVVILSVALYIKFGFITPAYYIFMRKQ